MSEIERAVEILRAGGLVAFPTETVYGLGADARNADAVRRIFAAKGRPSTNPLIVHISGVAMAKLYAAEWPDTARRLAQKFWPGPLTLVLPRFRTIAPEVSAGWDTVGLRMPNHPLALKLIQRFDGPIAAPSANRSNHISPTTAKHVREELGDAVDVILDGGPCTVGIESTVLDLTVARPKILRPGGIARGQIEKVVGPIDAADMLTEVSTPARSPGQHETHYAPRTPAFRFQASERGALHVTPTAGLVTLGAGVEMKRHKSSIALPASPAAYAHHLYGVLRELDAMGLEAIYVEMPPDRPEWTAVRDRLIRATRPM
ncbi:MAG TPA: L-threonylcarbamoyladenylate synthase [Tepidisphaeraceae bacterium]|nr:L-threonylcarbamoyladenylate synthase [Tepidisphaeraceae bacterium]